MMIASLWHLIQYLRPPTQNKLKKGRKERAVWVQSRHSIRLADHTIIPEVAEIEIILVNSRDRKEGKQ